MLTLPPHMTPPYDIYINHKYFKQYSNIYYSVCILYVPMSVFAVKLIYVNIILNSFSKKKK